MNLRQSLIATAAATALLGTLSTAADAASFGTNGISFDEDTTVKFTFFESHGAFQSALSIFEVGEGSVLTPMSVLFEEIKPSDNGAANEWKGTFGNTVVGSQSVKFTFLAGKSYTLGLTTPATASGFVYSTTALNIPLSQQAVFGDPGTLLPELNLGSTDALDTPEFFIEGDLASGPVLISLDDRGNGNDIDFQDFTITAEAVPEPATLAGLGMVIGSLVVSRRRRSSANA